VRSGFLVCLAVICTITVAQAQKCPAPINNAGYATGAKGAMISALSHSNSPTIGVMYTNESSEPIKAVQFDVTYSSTASSQPVQITVTCQRKVKVGSQGVCPLSVPLAIESSPFKLKETNVFFTDGTMWTNSGNDSGCEF
jgi:hypothetical protein